ATAPASGFRQSSTRNGRGRRSRLLLERSLLGAAFRKSVSNIFQRRKDGRILHKPGTTVPGFESPGGRLRSPYPSRPLHRPRVLTSKEPAPQSQLPQSPAARHLRRRGKRHTPAPLRQHIIPKPLIS